MQAKAMLALALPCLAACAPSENTYRPNRPMNAGRQFDVACEAGQSPRMVSGKSPVFPVGMLNPYVIDDRRTRHLPMKWEVTTTFDIDAAGKTRNVVSTPTTPQSFSDHMTIAVRAWRFTPGEDAAHRCEVVFTYFLEG